MKTKLQKEMRSIRIQLKKHNISVEKKLQLREKLEALKYKMRK